MNSIGQELRVRRVVTGHDAQGQAVVTLDETSTNVTSLRRGQQSCVVWASDVLPADNNDPGDGARHERGTSLPEGAVFRIVRYDPGVAPRNHRTDSLDFAVVLSGEILMRLDQNEVRLRAGDTLVQRGTIHNWVNDGVEPCLIAFVLLGAKPAAAAGRALEAQG